MPDPERRVSPWRCEYIRRGEGGDDGGFLFCDLAAAGRDQDEANHLLARGQRSSCPQTPSLQPRDLMGPPTATSATSRS